MPCVTHRCEQGFTFADQLVCWIYDLTLVPRMQQRERKRETITNMIIIKKKGPLYDPNETRLNVNCGPKRQKMENDDFDRKFGNKFIQDLLKRKFKNLQISLRARLDLWFRERYFAFLLRGARRSRDRIFFYSYIFSSRYIPGNIDHRGEWE